MKLNERQKEEKRTMIEHTIKVVTAIICITALEAIALSQGINGLLLTLAIGAIAGLGGYEIKNLRDWLGKKKNG